MKNNFIIIGFDADDTLWVNESYYRDIEKQFCIILSEFGTEKYISDELYKVELKNLNLYGYGAKAFTLSLIETALIISDNGISQSIITNIIELGKSLINKPVVLLDNVQEVLDKLHKKGKKLIIATKGDLLDQERKLKKSNIDLYFHHIEVMSDKKESDYLKLLAHLDIEPEDFLMIGNSLKSDIKPVLNIGGYGIHIPYHTTWQHEEIPKLDENDKYLEIEHINELIRILEI